MAKHLDQFTEDMRRLLLLLPEAGRRPRWFNKYVSDEEDPFVKQSEA
jgi:hypothetical protein